MDQKTKDRLKARPRTICAKCQSRRNSCNPMDKCFECKQSFCYDHIECLQFKNGMSESDELRSICGDCKKSFGYRTL